VSVIDARRFLVERRRAEAGDPLARLGFDAQGRSIVPDACAQCGVGATDGLVVDGDLEAVAKHVALAIAKPDHADDECQRPFGDAVSVERARRRAESQRDQNDKAETESSHGARLPKPAPAVSNRFEPEDLQFAG
jgi:hypothetical protein